MTQVSGLVSYVMPLFNKEAFLEETLESLLEQSYPHWELILVDDGSTDLSGEIARHYAFKDPRIKYYKIKHQGICVAMGYGFFKSFRGNRWSIGRR